MRKISEANKQFRDGNYQKALDLYEKIILQIPTAEMWIHANIELTKNRLYSHYKLRSMITTGATPPGKKSAILKGTSSNYEGKLEKVIGATFKGWAVSKSSPSATVELDVVLDGILLKKEKNSGSRKDLERHGKSKGQGGVSFTVPQTLLNQPKHQVELRFPDGSLLAKAEIYGQKQPQSPVPVWVPVKESVSVIIPIYNALDDLKICIKRLISYTCKEIDVILINDASPDPEVANYLESSDLPKNFRVFHNAENLGFTKTVNKGIALAGKNDVVLLNSDARVTPRWLIGLRRALSRGAEIATVTPMSDRAGAFSAPNIGNENDLPPGITEVSYALAFRRRSVGHYPTVPTGNGFCMYIRRSALNEVGLLDEEAFPRGYGEENDFCMRARALGWKSVIDDRTYVFHDRNKSFGEQKNRLVVEGRAVLDARYSDYTKAISVFRNSDQIKSARYHASMALGDCDQPVLPRVLYVISTVTGGTPQTNKDLMFALKGAIEPWLFRCDSKTMTLWKVGQEEDQVIETHDLQEQVDPLTHRSSEYDRVIQLWLDKYDFEIVHIRHLAWHSLSLPKLSKQQGAKVVKSFHDFYSVCPTVKLIDDQGKYCGGQCTNDSSKDCNFKLWPNDSLPKLKGAWVERWKNQFSEALAYCDAFVTTSQSAKNTITKNLSLPSDIPFEVIEHGRDFKKFRAPDVTKKVMGPVRIVFPGNLDSEKGLNIIKDLLEIDHKGRIEIHILGKSTEILNDNRVIHHGEYQRENFISHIESINPHLGAVLSVWDETWCHTLTELWAAGVPVIAFNFPTIASRIRQSNAGWISSSNTKALYDSIINTYTSPASFEEALRSVEHWQKTFGLAQNNQLMAAQYLNLYKGKSGDSLKEIISVVCPASSDLKNAPGSTFVRVWEKTHNSLSRENTYLKQTPDQLLGAIRSGFIEKGIIQRNALTAGQWVELKEHVNTGEFDYIFDIDDDLIDVPREKDPNNKYLDYRATLADIVSCSKLVLVSTKTLFKKYRDLNPSILIEENKLSKACWGGATPKPLPTLPQINFLYYGSATHDEDLSLIIPALSRLYEENPNVGLKLVGVSSKRVDYPFVDFVDIPDNAKNYPSFVNFLRTVSESCAFGLAPLCANDFNVFKSDLKIKEYLGLGLPVVASNFGPYSEWSNYAILSNTEDWYRTLKKIVRNHSSNKPTEGIVRPIPEVFFINEDEFDRKVAVSFLT